MVLNGNVGEEKALNGKTGQITSGMNQPVKLKPLGLRLRAVCRQVLVVILANLSVLNTGVALGFSSVTLGQLQREPYFLTDSQQSWYSAIVAAASPMSGLLSGYLMDKLGRKRSILFTNLIAVVGWSIMIAASNDMDTFFIQIMISRFIVGSAAGMATSPAGVYTAEISHPQIRGRLTLGTTIAVASGITIIYTFGYFIRDDYRLLSIIACCYSFTALILTLRIPETPNWLLAKGRTEEAKKSLRYLRGLKASDQHYYEEFETEFNGLKRTATANREETKKNIIQVVKAPEVYKPLLIMIAFFACQQFSGIFVIIVYAVQFSIEAGVEIDPVLCAIFIGLTRLFTTMLIGTVLDRWGRRPPALASAFGMSICMILLACTSWFKAVGDVPYLSIICIVLFIFTSTLGLMTLPFTMISEVFPQKVRGIAAGFSICCGYTFGFIVIKLYIQMVIGMGKENVFAFYGMVSVAAIFFVYFFLPETKGKSLAEVEEYFKYGKKGKPNSEVEMKEILVAKK